MIEAGLEDSKTYSTTKKLETKRQGASRENGVPLRLMVAGG
jgi:hypothetical protein